MDFDEVLFTRRSVRKFDASKKVSKAQMEKILEAAMSAPSACNCRPWKFIAVNDSLMLSKIAKIHPYCGFLKDAGSAVIVCADALSQYKSPDGEGYYPADCSAATQNILLKAREMGIASCWCGIYPVQSRMEDFAFLFNLPENILAFSLVVLGFSDEKFSRLQSRTEWDKVDFSNWKE